MAPTDCSSNLIADQLVTFAYGDTSHPGPCSLIALPSRPKVVTPAYRFTLLRSFPFSRRSSSHDCSATPAHRHRLAVCLLLFQRPTVLSTVLGVLPKRLNRRLAATHECTRRLAAYL